MSDQPVDLVLRSSGIPWMGAVPAHWETKAVKHVAQLSTDRVDTLPAGARYVGLEHIASNTGQFAPVTSEMQTAAESTVNRFCKGDVLFGKLRPYLAKAVVADTDGYCSSEILVYRPQTVAAEYLKHAMLLEGFIQDVSASTYGSKMPRADAAFINRLAIPVPPLTEQYAITSYLDIETARIDALIEEKNRCVDLLFELRASIVREMTTGCEVAGPRVETGNQFMPSIPASWHFVPIGRYAAISNGSTPLKDNAAYWAGGTYPWLNSSVVNHDEVIDGSEFVTELALRQCHLPIVPPGNVVVALTGQGKTRGRASVLRIEATINQHLAAILTDPEIIDGEYLFWVLTGHYAALRMVSDGQGGTKGALTCEELGRFQVPLPPLSAQKSIAARLYEDTGRVNDLLRHVKRELELLAELRSSTITDAVLGRIDVHRHQVRPPTTETAA